MAFDLGFSVLALLVVVAAARSGVACALAGLVLLSLGGLAAVRLEGVPLAIPPVIAILLVWLALVIAVAAGRAKVAGRPGPAGRALGGAVGIVQAALVTVALSGAFLGTVLQGAPDAAEALREATVYRAVARIGQRAGAPQLFSDLAFPDPATRGRAPAKPEPARPIDWAETRTWDGGAVRALPGRAKALDQTPLGFEIDGRVRTVNARIGDRFSAGDVLASLETRALEIALQERKAALTEAEAQVEEARQDLELQLTRYGRCVLSEARYETARAALETAQSREAVARAAIDRARDRLENATLRAPYDGTIAARRIEPAQVVRAAEPAFEIQGNGGGFEIDATVPDTLVADLKVGSTHAVRVLDGSDARMTAVLREIGTRATSTAGFPVTLRTDGAGTRLRAGMNVEVLFRLDGRTDRGLVSIPLAAVLAGEGQSREVFVFDGDTGTLQRRAVQLARTEGRRALVADGLAPGEIVATRGVPFLRDGMAVTLKDVGVVRYDT